MLPLLLSGLSPAVVPTSGPGKEIALTSPRQQGGKLFVFTSVALDERQFSVIERVKWSFYFRLVRRLDNNFVIPSRVATASPFSGVQAFVNSREAVNLVAFNSIVPP